MTRTVLLAEEGPGRRAEGGDGDGLGFEVEIADGVRVRQMRQMVSDVRTKGEPVKDDSASG